MDTKAKLHDIVDNLWWSWNPDALDLFRRLNPEGFRVSNSNPMAALKRARADLLEDIHFQKEVDAVHARFSAYRNVSSSSDSNASTAYFCMEFGLHESLPLYSGGLGILAGDHLKAASDENLPLIAIGLLLRDGYFKQYFDEQFMQQAEYPSVDVTKHPLKPVLDENGKTLFLSVHCGEEEVFFRAWRLDVGRVPLYLLDTDITQNRHETRFLTSRLYQGRTHIRLKQEIILGIGGVRLLRALGKEVDVYHMNEGHCAFLTLELLGESGGLESRDAVSSRCVFTTHTPVKAGHDRFQPKRVLEELDAVRRAIGCSKKEFLGLGRSNPENDEEPFTMTILALNLSRNTNGVSELNGHVARKQWHFHYPDLREEEVPIGHITNGIHIETWASPHTHTLFAQDDDNWLEDLHEGRLTPLLGGVSDDELWNYRTELRKELVAFANERASRQSFEQSPLASPEALTIGFARRFAGYKRAWLLFSDLARAAALFSNPDKPIQMIISGKAHPENHDGRRTIKHILEIAQLPEFAGKILFLENYHMGIARKMISGSDVWLNNPRRPYEACGTSGQKVLIHGGLNVSVLDGWWAEAYNGANGWAIGPDKDFEGLNVNDQDTRDAERLYSLLEESVIPSFFDRDERGLPVSWLNRIRESMRSSVVQYSARRMIRDYNEEMYSVSNMSTAQS